MYDNNFPEINDISQKFQKEVYENGLKEKIFGDTKKLVALIAKSNFTISICFKTVELIIEIEDKERNSISFSSDEPDYNEILVFSTLEKEKMEELVDNFIQEWNKLKDL